MNTIFNFIATIILQILNAVFIMLNFVVNSTLLGGATGIEDGVLDGNINNGILNTFFDVFPGLDNAYKVFQMLAVMIATFIFIYQVFRFIISRDSRTLDSPLSLVTNFVVAVFGIYWSIPIANVIIRIGTIPYAYFASGSFLGDIDGGSVLGSFFSFDISEMITGVSEAVLSVGMAYLSGGVTVLISLFVTILLLIILLNSYFRLITEVFERYVTLGILVIFSPFLFAMNVSDSTRPLLGNWFKMIISQMVLLVVSTLFLGIFTASIFYATTSSVHMLAHLFLLIVWVKTASRFESHMQTMGFTAASGGGGFGGELIAGAYGASQLVAGGVNAATGTDYKGRGMQPFGKLMGDTMKSGLANGPIGKSDIGKKLGLDQVSAMDSMDKGGKTIGGWMNQQGFGGEAVESLSPSNIANALDDGRMLSDETGALSSGLANFMGLDLDEAGVEATSGYLNGETGEGYMYFADPETGEEGRLTFKQNNGLPNPESAFHSIGTDGNGYDFDVSGAPAISAMTGSPMKPQGEGQEDILGFFGKGASSEVLPDGTPALSGEEAVLSEVAPPEHIDSGFITAPIGDSVAVGADTLDEFNNPIYYSEDDDGSFVLDQENGNYVQDASGEFVPFVEESGGQLVAPVPDASGISYSSEPIEAGGMNMFVDDGYGNEYTLANNGFAQYDAETGLVDTGTTDADGNRVTFSPNPESLITDSQGNVTGMTGLSSGEKVTFGQTLDSYTQGQEGVTIKAGTYGLSDGSTFQTNGSSTPVSFYDKSSDGSFVKSSNGSYLPDSNGKMKNVGKNASRLAAAPFQPKGSIAGNYVSTQGGYKPLYNSGVLETNNKGQVAVAGSGGQKEWATPSADVVKRGSDGSIQGVATEDRVMSLLDSNGNKSLKRSFTAAGHKNFSEGAGVLSANGKTVLPIASQGIDGNGNLSLYNQDGSAFDKSQQGNLQPYTYVQKPDGSSELRSVNPNSEAYTPKYSVAGIETDARGNVSLNNLESYSQDENGYHFKTKNGQDFRLYNMNMAKPRDGSNIQNALSGSNAGLTRAGNAMDDRSSFIVMPDSTGRKEILPSSVSNAATMNNRGYHVMDQQGYSNYFNQFQSGISNPETRREIGNIQKLAVNESEGTMVAETANNSRFVFHRADMYESPQFNRGDFKTANINGINWLYQETNDNVSQGSGEQFRGYIMPRESKLDRLKSALPDGLINKRNSGMKV